MRHARRSLGIAGLVLASAFLLLANCTLKSDSSILPGKSCPCAGDERYRCDDATQTCIIPHCTDGTDPCDGAVCLDLNTDLENCGSCGHPCPNGPNAITSCDGGHCVIAACLGFSANCDGVVPNGCEVNLGTEPAHCGSCGNACPTGLLCRDGKCICSDQGPSGCGEGAVCTLANRCICHKGDQPCGTGETCGTGACSCGGAPPCASNEVCCGSGCTRIDENTSCGGCGRQCPEGFSCTAKGDSYECVCDTGCGALAGSVESSCDTEHGRCVCGGTLCKMFGARCLADGSCG